ncbi:hypothetical protein BH18ACT17_BH18ACT17_09440 [soil metagenome]
MGAEHRLARAMFDEAHGTFVDNVRGISIEEALDAGGGFRSILGLMKHTVGWSIVYHSYAFDDEPRSWHETEWPRGLREEIEPTDAYLQEILEWSERAHERWLASSQAPMDLDAERPLPWDRAVPLREILAMMAGHESYHAGEINMILAIRRGEAWEGGEEVEENHISTGGHGVEPAR